MSNKQLNLASIENQEEEYLRQTYGKNIGWAIIALLGASILFGLFYSKDPTLYDIIAFLLGIVLVSSIGVAISAGTSNNIVPGIVITLSLVFMISKHSLKMFYITVFAFLAFLCQ